MDLLAAMRSFRRVVELGSFSRAAEDLSLSPAGLSKQIRQLEEHLGAVLIQRTTRRMSLTEAGGTYFAECCRLLDGLQELERSVSENATEVTGRLRVNAPVSFGLTVLSPLLPAFLDAYPKLKLDLTLSDQLLDVVGAGFDVSIRVRAELADSSLVARRLADVEQVLCASPAYLERNGTPVTLDDLHQHACLAYSLADQPATWRLDGPEGAVSVAVQARVSANNSLMLRDLLVAGAGVGALPSFLAEPHIERGSLVRVLAEYRFPARHVFAIYPTARHLQRRFAPSSSIWQRLSVTAPPLRRDHEQGAHAKRSSHQPSFG
jgi:DNA-binding transcriptional LysR family regulator